MDKSLPYKRIILRREPGTPLPEFAVPPGFRISRFRAGDEIAWAEIETSAGERYVPTRGFYLKNGYRVEATMADFYSPGDGKVIFVKDL